MKRTIPVIGLLPLLIPLLLFTMRASAEQVSFADGVMDSTGYWVGGSSYSEFVGGSLSTGAFSGGFTGLYINPPEPHLGIHSPILPFQEAIEPDDLVVSSINLNGL